MNITPEIALKLTKYENFCSLEQLIEYCSNSSEEFVKDILLSRPDMQGMIIGLPAYNLFYHIFERINLDFVWEYALIKRPDMRKYIDNMKSLEVLQLIGNCEHLPRPVFVILIENKKIDFKTSLEQAIEIMPDDDVILKTILNFSNTTIRTKIELLKTFGDGKLWALFFQCGETKEYFKNTSPKDILELCFEYDDYSLWEGAFELENKEEEIIQYLEKTLINKI